MFFAMVAQAQTDTSGSSSSTVPTLTIASSTATATEGEEVTYTVTASSAPTAALPVVVHVRAHGEVMDTRTVAEVLLPAGATTVTLRLEEFTDEIDESRVNVTLTLAGGTGYSVGDPAEATVSIDYPTDSGTQATPTPAPAVSPPDAPSGVSISAPSINSFTVSWTAEAGKAYRVEREAAFLFSYGVWQTVADNLSSGSFTESELPCDLFYVFQVRAKKAGSAYGVGTRVLGPAQACQSSPSSGARTVRAVGTPMPQLRIVTDNPEQDRIQIRLLLYGSPDEVYNPIRNMDMFQVDRSERYAGSGDPVFPSPAIREESEVAEFDWGGLECGSSYYFRARGHGNGESDGFTAEWGKWSHEPPREAQGTVHGSTRRCTLSLPPTPSNVTASITPGTGGSKYDVELQWDVLTGVASFRVERSDDGGTTWPHVTKGIPRSPHPVTDLPCDQDYVFRVSAYGDGKKYRADYGPAREVSQYTPIDTRSTRSASGSFLCTKPDVTVIPQPERKIKLKWDELGLGPGIGQGYTYKVQAIKYEGNFAIDEMTPEIGSAGTATFREIDLDNIIGGDGLADHTKGYLIRVTATVGTQTGYTELIIIDTPILKALGNSAGSGNTHGEVTLSWTDVHTVVDDADFNHASGRYAFNVRRLGNSQAGHHHTKLEWKPDNYIDINMPNAAVDGDDKITGLMPEEIHAIQLIYTVDVTKPTFTKEVKVFAARDAYVWPSDRPAGNGERVATYPLNYPLRNAQGVVNKTYAYYICKDTFDFTTRSDDWEELIVHAIGQWDLATNGLVTTTHLGQDCANYAGVLKVIADGTPATVDQARRLIMNFDVFGDISEPDKAKNEVILLNESSPLFDLAVNDAAEFPELARYIGLDPCGFEARACALPNPDPYAVLFTLTPPYRLDLRTTDILLNYRALKVPDPANPGQTMHPPLTIPGGSSGSPQKPDKGDVVFNACVDPEPNVYRTIVHEAGHALGIWYGSDHDPADRNYTTHHPTIADSAVNYDWKAVVWAPDPVDEEPDCSPHPFDILAIFALYQTY